MNEEGERGTRNLWCAPTTMRKICRKLFMVLICNYFHKRDTNHLPCGDFFIQKKNLNNTRKTIKLPSRKGE